MAEYWYHEPAWLLDDREFALPAMPTPEEARRALLGRVLSRAELAMLPKPEPMIMDWLDLRTSVLLIGETGTNKTFTALGWACAVATGTDWLGHKVCLPPTPVLYVVGEGAYGLHGRISAWEEHTGTDVPPQNLTVIMQPHSLNSPDTWEAITAEALKSRARLVVLDTFSALAPDADETTDAALMVRRMADLAVRLDGTVVLVHHTGWSDKGRARGGSQLEANPDAVVVLEKTAADPELWDAPVSVTRKKVKDGPAGRRLWVVRTPVDVADLEDPQAVLVEAPPVASPLRVRAAPTHDELVSLVGAWVADNPGATQNKAQEAIAVHNRVGDKRVRVAWDAAVEAGLIKPERGMVRERSRGGVERDVERDIWVPGDGLNSGRPSEARPVISLNEFKSGRQLRFRSGRRRS